MQSKIHSFLHSAWWRSVRLRLLATVLLVLASLSVVLDWPVPHQTYHVYMHSWSERDRAGLESIQWAGYFNTSPTYMEPSFVRVLERSDDPSSVFKAALTHESSDAGIAYALYGLVRTDPDYFLDIAPLYKDHETRKTFPIKYGSYCLVEKMSFEEFVEDLQNMIPEPGRRRRLYYRRSYY